MVLLYMTGATYRINTPSEQRDGSVFYAPFRLLAFHKALLNTMGDERWYSLTKALRGRQVRIQWHFVQRTNHLLSDEVDRFFVAFRDILLPF